MDSGGSKETCIRWECTLAQPGEYDWTVYVRRRCSLFVKLFWPFVYRHVAMVETGSSVCTNEMFWLRCTDVVGVREAVWRGQSVRRTVDTRVCRGLTPVVPQWMCVCVKWNSHAKLVLSYGGRCRSEQWVASKMSGQEKLAPCSTCGHIPVWCENWKTSLESDGLLISVAWSSLKMQDRQRRHANDAVTGARDNVVRLAGRGSA